MDKNEIVWVYGGSAAGKETFIQYIIQNHPKKLIEQLGWKDKNITHSQESIDWVAHSGDDPRGPKRAELPESIAKLSSQHSNTVILIKGQDLDLENDRLRKTRECISGAKFKIIYIDTHLDEVFERLKRKPWFQKNFTKEMAKEWLEHQLQYLYELRDDFEVIALDGNARGKYEFVSFPKVLSSCGKSGKS